jgi:DNA-binding transcriptional ArsR family regulator
METGNTPQLSWDFGTAYDFFTSLEVLHQPEKFGLRGSWAAGVRSRLPAPERRMLEDAGQLVHVPLAWVNQLPEPKDAATALWELGRLPAAARLPALALSAETPAQSADTFREVASRGAWEVKHLEKLRSAYQAKLSPPRAKSLVTMLEWWARPDVFGERYLGALQAYQQAFFAEEADRLCPILERVQARARARAAELDLPALLEELSQGVRFASLAGVAELVLAPSYWVSPLVIFGRVGGPAGAEKLVLLYGARPADVSLVPGEIVPDAVLRALKALADPTRLRILRYLASQPHTPAQLARRLRLRAPTVIHHLNALRLAGLVQLTLASEGERRYALRPETIPATFSHLQEFLNEEPDPEDGD